MSTRSRNRRRDAARTAREGRGTTAVRGGRSGRAAPRRNPEVTVKRAGLVLRVISVVVGLVLVWAVLAIVRPWEGSSGQEAALIAPDTHVLNDAGAGAPVVVEFLDFECEACGALYPIMEDLRERYGDRVTFAVRYFPLPGHANSTNAALAAEAAAQQDRFEEMYQRLFETQTEWGELGESQPEIFRTHAEAIGLDMAAYDTAVADPLTLERVTEDSKAGRDLGVSGTPTIFIDGERVELSGPDDLEQAIVTALGE